MKYAYLGSSTSSVKTYWFRLRDRCDGAYGIRVTQGELSTDVKVAYVDWWGDELKDSDDNVSVFTVLDQAANELGLLV